LALPQQIEYSFQEKLASFAEEQNMVYINSIERMGIAKGKAEGLAEGKAEGLRESILQVLKTRWGGIDPKWSRQLEGIGAADRLSHLLQVALTAESPQQWQQEFDPR
jgi:flagellar biosynthesis/type III secretory pathway protein FliH